MARTRVRSNSQAFLLYESNTALGWSISRRLSFLRGEVMVERGLWRRVNDVTGNHVGYQPYDEPLAHDVAVLPGTVTQSALTARESMANAGLMGRSRTTNLTEDQRLARRHCKQDGTEKILPPEDFVELTRAKVGLYHESVNRGGDRAVRVYPRRVAAAVR